MDLFYFYNVIKCKNLRTYDRKEEEEIFDFSTRESSFFSRNRLEKCIINFYVIIFLRSVYYKAPSDHNIFLVNFVIVMQFFSFYCYSNLIFDTLFDLYHEI